MCGTVILPPEILALRQKHGLAHESTEEEVFEKAAELLETCLLPNMLDGVGLLLNQTVSHSDLFKFSWVASTDYRGCDKAQWVLDAR